MTRRRRTRRNHGHIRERSPGHWEIRISLGKDAAGKWKTATATVEGTREDAESALARLQQSQRQGVNVRPNKLTLSEYFDGWLISMRPQISPRSHERYTEIVNNNIIPALGSATKLRALTKEQITALYAAALENGRMDGKGGLAPATVTYMHRVLKQALLHAGVWRREWDGRRGIRPPRIERRRMAVYNAGGAANLIELARPSPLFIPILLAVTTGMRRGEVAALRWRNVDLAKARVSVEEAAEQTKKGVRYKPPKSDKGRRTVALLSLVVDELRAHRARQAEELLRLGIRLSDDSFVVAKADGSPYQPRSLTHAFRQFRTKHKLPRIPLKNLRHSHATEMLSSKIHPKIVQERLGHSTIAITMDIYSHVLEGMQEEAAGIVDATLRLALEKRAK